MAWIYVDKEDGGSQGEKMRQVMRRNMRDGHHVMDGSGSSYRDGYRMGYRHGWEDKEDDDDEMYDERHRRSRDSRGRYI